MTFDPQSSSPASPRRLPPEDPSKTRRRKTLNEIFAGALLVGFIMWWAHINDWNTGHTVAFVAAATGIAFVFLLFRALYRIGEPREPSAMPTPPVSTPPPGWYVDAAGATRWFDGHQWTDITQLPPKSDT
ncbi:DUF2510 domain-containing protein [Nocardia cyriacigeorgica]|uniref:DUF2510 domain-containing protein n=1 Tax=Nocardia cyriacigeorgica TaxID=135487 RepID=UPI001E3519BC|nr:DUF2510 domain-containing protein [Nocardia cyriacigeorgica]